MYVYKDFVLKKITYCRDLQWIFVNLPSLLILDPNWMRD